MLTRRTLHIDDRYRPVLAAASLDSFERLMYDRNVGDVVHVKPSHEVRRIEVAGESGASVFYLKRTAPEPIGRLLKLAMKGVRPDSRACRERRMIGLLQSHGIEVMTPAAWGQRSMVGLGREGFLLTAEVAGELLEHVYRDADEAERRRICIALGDLLGRLNQAGFFGALRLRDMIVRRDQGLHLVLIDREADDVRPQPVTAERRRRCLARCYCKLRQMGHDLTDAHAAALLDAYTKQTGDDGSWLRNQVCEHIKRLTAPGAKYHGLT